MFNARRSDFLARQILADVAGMTVNDTTNSLTTRIIFGNNRKPQEQVSTIGIWRCPLGHERKDRLLIEKKSAKVNCLECAHAKVCAYVGEYKRLVDLAQPLSHTEGPFVIAVMCQQHIPLNRAPVYRDCLAIFTDPWKLKEAVSCRSWKNKADVKETEAVYKNSSEIAMAGLVEAQMYLLRSILNNEQIQRGKKNDALC